MMKPNLFIVGAAKSGTTALYEYLNAHPDIYMSALKEPHFFGSEWLSHNKSDKQHLTLDDYLHLFEAQQNERYVGEASPSYLVDASAADEIHKFNPDARILISLRNPIDMLHSSYQHRQFMGNEKRGTFEEIVIPALQDRDSDDVHDYLRFVQYTKHIRRYFETFGEKQVCVLIFEEWVKTPEQMYADLLNWLGLEAYDLPEFERVNSSKEVRSPFISNILFRLGLTPRQVKRSRLYNVAMKVVPPALLQKLLSGAVQIYTRPSEKEDLSPETRAYLLEIFEEEITALEDLLQRDLSQWRK